MSVITGKIMDKESIPGSIHNKTKMTIENANDVAFIEFRGNLKKIADKLPIYENIMVEYFHEGKISKNSGIKFNNLIATNVTKI